MSEVLTYYFAFTSQILLRLDKVQISCPQSSLTFHFQLFDFFGEIENSLAKL